MNIKSNYYHIDESAESLILSDRLDIEWKEILYYPIPLAVFMFYLSGSNILIAFSFAIVFGFLYMVFRYFAWFVYKEFKIDKSQGTVHISRKLLNRTSSIEMIAKEFNFESVRFDEQKRSGKTKYILQYVTYKTSDILVIKNYTDRMNIEERLKAIETNRQSI